MEKQLSQTHELLAKLTAALDAAEGSRGGSPPSSASEQNRHTFDYSSLASTHRGPASTSINPDDIESSDDEGGTHSLNAALKRLKLEGFSPPTFVGKSSDLTLIQTALDVKQDYAGQAGPSTTMEDVIFPHHSEASWLEGQFAMLEDDKFPPDSFPEPSMLWSFIELYFDYCNIFTPLLHRPTFEKNVADGLHLRDGGFGATVLLVCAIGAKLSDDPRVTADVRHPSSPGWTYFVRVQSTRKALKLGRASLYEVQIPCVRGSPILRVE